MFIRGMLGRAIFGIGSIVLIFWEWQWGRRVLGAVTGFDFLYERAKDPSWIGAVVHAALNPPPGTALLVAFLGLVLIYWGTKAREIRMSWPVLGMLVCVIGFAGFGFWYLSTSRDDVAAKPNVATHIQLGPEKSSAPANPNPGFEIAHGPYQPEEVRTMILTLGKIQDILDREGHPGFEFTQQTLQNWPNQLRADPSHFIARLREAQKKIVETRYNADREILQISRRLQPEVTATIDDGKDAVNSLGTALSDAASNLEILSKANGVDITQILSKDMNRVSVYVHRYLEWLQLSNQRVGTKDRRLRDYKP
jgi:hypothetical protein